MSVAVSLEQLEDRIAEFGELAYLTTVSAEGRAHVVSVTATLDGDSVRVRVGRTSSANVEAHSAVTLLWTALENGAYCLILDGVGTLEHGEDGELVIHPTRAVLHRVAGASRDLPSCIPLEQPA